MKYTVTHACGHTEEVVIYGPGKDREWKIKCEEERFCPDCYEKQKTESRAKETDAAAIAAMEMGLPSLIGSEKQIAWALTIRQEKVDKISDMVEKIKPDADPDAAESFRVAFVHMKSTQIEAHWWIDRKDMLWWTLMDSYIQYMKSLDEQEKKTEPGAVSAALAEKAAATVRPENAITDAPVEIRIKDDVLSIAYEKNDTLIKIMIDHKHDWDRDQKAWIRKINKFSGPIADRAAEIGNTLLHNGFPIMIADEAIRKMAVDGSYKLEQKRWVKILTNQQDKLILVFDRNDELYSEARRLPGARWDKGIVVPVSSARAIQDFAVAWHFAISDASRERMDIWLDAQKKSLVVTPAKAKKEASPEGLKAILNSSREVINDLKD